MYASAAITSFATPATPEKHFLSEGSIEVAIAAGGFACGLDVVEYRAAFGEVRPRARTDGVTACGFDGRYARIDVDFGGATDVTDAIANAVATNVGIGDGGKAATGEDTIGRIDEFLAGGAAVEFIVVTTASGSDEGGEDKQQRERPGRRCFRVLHGISFLEGRERMR